MAVATIESPASAARLNMGWTVGTALQVLVRRWADILLVSVPFVILPVALEAFLQTSTRSVANLAVQMIGLVFVGAVSLITYQEITGTDRLSGWDAIKQCTRLFGSLWWVNIISGLAILIGLVLLVVPGVIALVGLVPAATTVVVENKKASAAIERAWELTRNSRWRILGLCVVVALAVCGVVGLGLAAQLALLTLAPDTSLTVLRLTMEPPLVFAMQALMTVFSATVYAGLRQAKEGSPGDIGGIFA